MPMSRAALGVVTREVIRRNRIRDGIVYMQVSRGTAPRNAAPFPSGLAPNVIMTARRVAPSDPAATAEGIGIKTVPDIRWGRRDIKTTALLPNAWAKQHAVEAGFKDAWLVDGDGFVTEGSSSNAWIVTKDKQIVTRPRSNDILWGVTRRRLLELAAELGLSLVERPFTVAEAKAASEAFLTSASAYVLPVTRIDDMSIGNGRAGSVTMALAERYHAHIRQSAG
jgi:D-alanine transaminase